MYEGGPDVVWKNAFRYAVLPQSLLRIAVYAHPAQLSRVHGPWLPAALPTFIVAIRSDCGLGAGRAIAALSSRKIATVGSASFACGTIPYTPQGYPQVAINCVGKESLLVNDDGRC
jgi:hypothetical protein